MGNPFEDTCARIESNRANALPLCACLKVCMTRMPYREAETILADVPVMDMSLQNPHALVGILIESGGIEAVNVPEAARSEDEPIEDQPVDYLLETTDAGRRALECFEPVSRFAEMVAEEPAGYAAVYAMVLQRCEGGAKLPDVESMLQGVEAMVHPKQVYPQYFVSRLETVGGLVWNGSWNTTEDGRRMLVSIG